MYEDYIVMTNTGDALRLHFLTAFRPHNIKSWSRPLLSKMIDLLIAREVHVEKGIFAHMDQTLIDLLTCKHHVP